MRLPHFWQVLKSITSGCTWTLCSTQSGDGWPQRSQLQPGVPSLRVYDEEGKRIETHKRAGEFKERLAWRYIHVRVVRGKS
jgi:hypothetical protein